MRPYELPDFFDAEEQPPPPLEDALAGVWWLLHTLERGEGGRFGWVELETALDRLGVVEPTRRDAWREACWILEEAAGYGTEVRMLREDEERESRGKGRADDRGLSG